VAAASADILAALARLLADPHVEVRRAAASAVGQLGVAAASADIFAALARLLADPHVEVRWAAASAVSSIGAAAATPEIFAVLGRGLWEDFAGNWQIARTVIDRIGLAAVTQEILAATAANLDDGTWQAREFTLHLSRRFDMRWLQRGGSYVTQHLNELSLWPPADAGVH
jgi:hypothetical protein